MIIDGHCHITDIDEPVWGWKAFTGDDLIKVMDINFPVNGKLRIVDKAVIMPALGITAIPNTTFEEQHKHVVDMVRKYPDRFIGNMVLNPRLGVEEGVKYLEKLVKEDNFRMVKLHPTMHNYWPNSPDLVYPIFEAARKLNIPVLIHTGEPPYSVPVLVAPLAKEFKDVPIIIAHLGTQKICYADECVYMAQHHDNIFLETGWGVQPRLIEAVRSLGSSRLIFGSDCPPMEIWSWVRPVEVLGWDPPLGVNLSTQEVENILGDNLAKLMGI